MKTAFKMFGETRLTRAEVYDGDKGICSSDTWDETLWVERGEDMYALMSPQLRNKKVLVVSRDDWLRGTPLDETSR